MNRIVIGALAALFFVGAGLFWWQGRAATERGAPPPEIAIVESPGPGPLPTADVGDQRGPVPPEASEATREQRRFARFDRDIDGRITRNELMAARTNDFRRLDTDRNNLLTFEEWAVTTGNRFKAADGNGDLWLTREEFSRRARVNSQSRNAAAETSGNQTIAGSHSSSASLARAV